MLWTRKNALHKLNQLYFIHAFKERGWFVDYPITSEPCTMILTVYENNRAGIGESSFETPQDIEAEWSLLFKDLRETYGFRIKMPDILSYRSNAYLN